MSQGTVKHNILSASPPNITIQVSSKLDYLGQIELDVNGLAIAEQHYFAQIRKGQLGITFIVHFEHFHADNEHLFDYPRLRMVNMAGFDFLHQCWALPDFELFKLTEVKHFFSELDIQTEPGWLVNRYVTVIDKARKHELILFYLEPASQITIPIQSLLPGREAFSQWPDTEYGLIKRANKIFSLKPA